ncbi:heavy-metal-associated domain-containing protein [Leptospira sp. 201903070]|jgi:copper chaperone|uniref:Heavy-metal-associated domain-containing protein n=1 Tax=Leptospira ainlahdjerensis TaxID=2810033 RepID=A0ABS2UAQ8_9LEPT|nr:heavy-metal-associated domain-containing protein [Leptospira ainlahdjerensis]MBM9576317.1 heavy-metal-associated domain-containing protein [Leptospira ainlahdjerensis]
MKEIKLAVEGMTCNHCQHTIESALKDIGFSSKASFVNKEVVYQGEGTEDELTKVRAAILEEGYNPGVVK